MWVYLVVIVLLKVNWISVYYYYYYYYHCTVGYRFAAMQSTQCHCGRNYNSYGEVDQRECNIKCSGNKKQNCGGDLTNSVYYTGLGEGFNSIYRKNLISFLKI